MLYKNILIKLVILLSLITKPAVAEPQASEAADVARFLYYLVAGQPDSGWPEGFEGPDGGLVGIIAEVTGDNALGGGLKSAGYQTCADIPLTGSAELVEAEGTFTMTFAAASKSIPAGWQNGGSNLDKRIEVAYDGADFMVAELSCDATSATGYIRMNLGVVENEQPRQFETYYQFDSNGRRELQFYMNYSDTYDERFSVIFSSEDGSAFQLYAIRGANENSNQGISIGLSGDFSTKKANIAYIDDEAGDIDDVTEIADASNSFCLNMETEVAESDCSELAISNPTPVGIVSSWTIGGVFNQSLSILE